MDQLTDDDRTLCNNPLCQHNLYFSTPREQQKRQPSTVTHTSRCFRFHSTSRCAAMDNPCLPSFRPQLSRHAHKDNRSVMPIEQLLGTRGRTGGNNYRSMD